MLPSLFDHAGKQQSAGTHPHRHPPPPYATGGPFSLVPVPAFHHYGIRPVEGLHHQRSTTGHTSGHSLSHVRNPSGVGSSGGSVGPGSPFPPSFRPPVSSYGGPGTRPGPFYGNPFPGSFTHMSTASTPGNRGGAGIGGGTHQSTCSIPSFFSLADRGKHIQQQQHGASFALSSPFFGSCTGGGGVPSPPSESSMPNVQYASRGLSGHVLQTRKRSYLLLDPVQTALFGTVYKAVEISGAQPEGMRLKGPREEVEEEKERTYTEGDTVSTSRLAGAEGAGEGEDAILSLSPSEPRETEGKTGEEKSLLSEGPSLCAVSGRERNLRGRLPSNPPRAILSPTPLSIPFHHQGLPLCSAHSDPPSAFSEREPPFPFSLPSQPPPPPQTLLRADAVAEPLRFGDFGPPPAQSADACESALRGLGGKGGMREDGTREGGPLGWLSGMCREGEEEEQGREGGTEGQKREAERGEEQCGKAAKKTAGLYAVKVIEKTLFGTSGTAEDPLAEIRLAPLLSEVPGFLPQEEWAEDREERFVFTVSPFAEGGDLSDALSRTPSGFTEAEARFLLKPLLRTVCELHARHTALRDISAENVLLFLESRAPHVPSQIRDDETSGEEKREETNEEKEKNQEKEALSSGDRPTLPLSSSVTHKPPQDQSAQSTPPSRQPSARRLPPGASREDLTEHGEGGGGTARALGSSGASSSATRPGHSHVLPGPSRVGTGMTRSFGRVSAREQGEVLVPFLCDPGQAVSFRLLSSSGQGGVKGGKGRGETERGRGGKSENESSVIVVEEPSGVLFGKAFRPPEAYQLAEDFRRPSAGSGRSPPFGVSDFPAVAERREEAATGFADVGGPSDPLIGGASPSSSSSASAAAVRACPSPSSSSSPPCGSASAAAMYDPRKVDSFCLGWLLFRLLAKAMPFRYALPSDPDWRFLLAAAGTSADASPFSVGEEEREEGQRGRSPEACLPFVSGVGRVEEPEGDGMGQRQKSVVRIDTEEREQRESVQDTDRGAGGQAEPSSALGHTGGQTGEPTGVICETLGLKENQSHSNGPEAPIPLEGGTLTLEEPSPRPLMMQTQQQSHPRKVEEVEWTRGGEGLMKRSGGVDEGSCVNVAAQAFRSRSAEAPQPSRPSWDKAEMREGVRALLNKKGVLGGVSEEAEDLLARLLHPCARLRATPTEVRDHPWFSGAIEPIRSDPSQSSTSPHPLLQADPSTLAPRAHHMSAASWGSPEGPRIGSGGGVCGPTSPLSQRLEVPLGLEQQREGSGGKRRGNRDRAGGTVHKADQFAGSGPSGIASACSVPSLLQYVPGGHLVGSAQDHPQSGPGGVHPSGGAGGECGGGWSFPLPHSVSEDRGRRMFEEDEEKDRETAAETAAASCSMTAESLLSLLGAPAGQQQ
uniref:non-specific serine/threonine protein kinase n=1 Tax=Chromera velia CCMP2878 TaxID=1169474 RepID=A0A0G4I1N8_9ALVE|eukprot:Cvel_1668.t1-p1 / transcript=Cvel_1668.t1 / gene=Cvel_1668 / organism=Chromera_velia_CCMP2878 / gene_product=hypothetical protein / transcript_product=hypothetical protein / location=Cvel_scaffold60:27192-33108(-) / protein_length=1390 / sequence_SO=supercontig / SO=protein_coding / is_pseudo=false